MEFTDLIFWAYQFVSGLSLVGSFLMSEISIPLFGDVTVLSLFCGTGLIAVLSYKVVRWFI